jgi:hypothetical protein
VCSSRVPSPCRTSNPSARKNRTTRHSMGAQCDGADPLDHGQSSPVLLPAPSASRPSGRPTCPSRASGRSSQTTPWGFPCCVRFPCVHAAANTPV